MLLGSAAVDAVTWVIELGVGIACLAIGVVAIRRGHRHLTGAVLVTAGAIAAGHASLMLVRS
jgi:hypothetical protein